MTGVDEQVQEESRKKAVTDSLKYSDSDFLWVSVEKYGLEI